MVESQWYVGISPGAEQDQAESIAATLADEFADYRFQYFDAAGFLDERPTKVKFSDITLVLFDDRYIDFFSKYLRNRKKKK